MRAAMLGTERRLAKRYRCSGRVEIPQTYTRVPLQGVLVDVSPTGCSICVPSGVDFDEEEECWVELKFNTSYLTFRAVAAMRGQHVQREVRGPVLGFEFVEVSARGQADIAALVRDQETRDKEIWNRETPVYARVS